MSAAAAEKVPASVADVEKHTGSTVNVNTAEKDTALDANNTEKPPQPPAFPTFPDGGTRAWLVVIGAMLANACSFGYSGSFG